MVLESKNENEIRFIQFNDKSSLNAIGSGDDVGSLNLKHLKQLISNILTRMDIANHAADEVSSDSGDKDVHDAAGARIEDLEDKIKQLGK